MYFEVMPREWESLNAKAELARMHRVGHCLEAVLLYVHHSRWRELPKGDVPRTVHKRGFTRISRAGNPKRKRPNCHRSVKPRSRGVGTPSWAGPLTTSPRGLWVSGYLPRAMADSAQGRRPENRPSDKGG